MTKKDTKQIEKSSQKKASTASSGTQRAVDRDILHNMPGMKAVYAATIGAIVAYFLSRVGAHFGNQPLFSAGTVVFFCQLIFGVLAYFHAYGAAKKLTRAQREREEQKGE